ncbi:MAG: cation:proton antiporter domain-containing protein [Stenotrophomonas sp.]
MLAIALGVAFGAAALFGVSFALGAFFAGMMLGESRAVATRRRSESLPLRDAFAVLFFVSVGMLFDPIILVEHPLAGAGDAWRSSCSASRSRRSSSCARSAIPTGHRADDFGVSLAQIGEFSFILAGLGVGLKMLPGTGRAT